MGSISCQSCTYYRQVWLPLSNINQIHFNLQPSILIDVFTIRGDYISYITSNIHITLKKRPMIHQHRHSTQEKN